MGIDSAPSCIQHGVPAADGTVKPYAHCSAFFTYASTKTFGESDNSVWVGASNGTILLVALGFIVCIAAIVAWVITEDGKLSAQAARLRARHVVPVGPAGHADDRITDTPS